LTAYLSAPIYGYPLLSFTLASIIRWQKDETSDDYCVQDKDILIDKVHKNNIITFNADRGQGKTSALHTFAQYLSNCNRQNRKINELFDKKIESKFEILPIIDPTELNSGESVIRIFISQLFKVYQDILEYLNSDISVQKERYEIIELFQKCYDNINYIQGKKEESEWTNDLESLMKLGNVSEIKENLRKLIDMVLKLKEKTKYQGELIKTDKLLVRIDDTDLCISDVFSICEDIREYLSLPNVVVLMALDIKQLKYAIFQRYVMKYKGILSLVGNADYYKNSMSEKCDYMASRYIEKMFPSGYVVDLPKLDVIVKKNYSNIKIDYKVNINGQYFDISEKDTYQNSKNIYEQLLNLLYERTGIIINKNSDRVHFILPASMRELNHFLRLLSQMKQINFCELYALEDTKDIKAIKRGREQKKNMVDNLHHFKRYYLNYCNPNRLGEELSNEFIKIDDSENVYYNLGKLIRDKIKGAGYKRTYSDIVHFLYEQSESSLLTESIEVFLDIILHETLLSVLEIEDKRKKFSEQFKGVIDWERKYGKSKITYIVNGDQKYNCFEFSLNLDNDYFKSIFYRNSDGKYKEKRTLDISTQANMQTFCCANNAGLEDIKFILKEENSNDYFINDDIWGVRFNMLKPFDGFFDLKNNFLASSDESSEMITQLYDLYMNVATNFSVIAAIEEKYKAYSKVDKFKDWKGVISDLYNSIDDKLDKNFGYIYGKYRNRIGSKIAGIFSDDIRFKKLFLSNEENHKTVVGSYKKKLRGVRDKAIKLLKEFKELKQISDAMEFVQQLDEMDNRSGVPFIDISTENEESVCIGEIKDLVEKEKMLNKLLVEFKEDLLKYKNGDEVNKFANSKDKIIDDYISEINSIGI
ncbi:hypothetical protein KQI69_03540, partial [Eubacterium sp. MSJ-13]|uniref:hypothetical protein n=1 Tax=Eubacterium sp. MSJ-13 TaxID=2841513 RepID=UPI001C116AE9